MANDPTANTNGWNEWSRHVLKELERLTESIENIRSDFQIAKSTYSSKDEVERMWDDIQALKIDFIKMMQEKDVHHIRQLGRLEKEISALERKIDAQYAEINYKAGVWGVLSGAIPVAIALLLYIIKNLI